MCPFLFVLGWKLKYLDAYIVSVRQPQGNLICVFLFYFIFLSYTQRSPVRVRIDKTWKHPHKCLILPSNKQATSHEKYVREVGAKYVPDPCGLEDAKPAC